LDKFDVVKIPSKYPFEYLAESHWEFGTAWDVALFMWGRWGGKYIIYKNGELASLSHIYPDVDSLRKYLEGDIHFPEIDKK
jgi:hypothetical protein